MLLPKRKYTKSDTERVVREVSRRAQIVSTMLPTKSSNKKAGLEGRIKSATLSVKKEFKNDMHLYNLVLEEDLLAHYIDTANETGILVIDHETSGLNPISDILAGSALYTEGLNACYVPVNHVSKMTGQRIDGQLTPEILVKHFKRLNDEVKTIYHNAKFDLRVFRNQLKLDMFKYLWWDTMIASCLLDENEDHDLKYLYGKYCGGGDVAKFKDLFKDIPFQFVPMDIGYLYAAKDAKMTYDLFKFQEPYLTAEHATCRSKGLEKVALYYQDIELPFIDSMAEMEDAGCEIDVKHLEDLSVKLHKELRIKEKAFKEACLPFDVEIHKYRLNNAQKCKLDDPISVSSPTQLSILIYDILKCESVDKKKPKSTEAPILVKLKNKYKDDADKMELFKCLSEYRHIEKLLTTYVDSIPKLINPVSGKLHTEFTQHVTRTGRLSSKNPNFQNLPKRSKVGKEVRRAFKAGDDEVLLFADYCFSDDTEVLTNKGWKLFKDLDKTELVAQWKDGLINFDKPLDYQEFDYKGVMKRIHGKFVDMLVSPNHNCLIVDDYNNMSFIKPDNFPKFGKHQVVSGLMFGSETINPNKLILMAAIQADAQVRINTIRFFLKKERKVERLKKCLDILNIPYTLNEIPSKPGFKVFSFYKKNLSIDFEKYLIDYKNFSENILNLDLTSRRFFLHELCKWDGSETDGQKKYCSCIKSNVDIMSRLAVTTGYRCTYTEINKPNRKVCYNLTFSEHVTVWVDRFKREDINYDGKIYCVTMPHNTVIVKRNGRIFITGQSKQEPAILGEESDDDGLKQSFIDGKDVYSDAAARAFNKSYEECCEKHSDGSFNAEGEKLRSKMKAIILGIMYEKQPISIAEDLRIPKKEAQYLYDTFFKMFPKVKTYRDWLIDFVEENGYVEMINGMRRGRIPDMMLPKYEITRVSEGNDFDPLDGIDDFDIDSDSVVDSKTVETELVVDDETYDTYYQAMDRAWGFQKKREIIDRAAEEGIKIVDNSFKIQEAIRQIVNTVIQGSAAIITKNAAVKLNASRVAKLRGRRPAFYKQLEPYIARSTYLKINNVILAIQVHDELIVRCKRAIAKEVRKITEDIMIESAADLITVPMKVDCDVSERWLGDKIEL